MFSIIIPIYNESDNIENLLNELLYNLKEYKDYEIILVNDCSTDNTFEVLSNIKNKNIKIINNSKNHGQSYSIHKGILNSIYNIIITIDGDGQNDPADIPNILDNYLSFEEFRLVGGIRIKRMDSFIKVISSKIANGIRSKILNDNCRDTGCSLKVFDKQIFLSFPFFDGMHRYGYKTMFIDVNHRKRKFGVSKYGTMNRLFKGIRDIIKVRKILKFKNYD